jgi:hypothetical protein
VIENGTIADVGRHEELMTRLGTYRRLYELQFANADSHKDDLLNADSPKVDSPRAVAET